MPTPITDAHDARPPRPERRLGGAAKSVAEHASAIVRLELELASLELKTKVTVARRRHRARRRAAIFALYMVGLLFATLDGGARDVPRDVALAADRDALPRCGSPPCSACIGINRIKKGTPPMPEQAIREAKLTTEAIKS